MSATKPRPVRTAEAAPYWEGAAKGELRFQRCRACGHAQFPPRTFCVACRAAELDWQRSSGRGVVHSVTVVRRAALEAFRPEVPYALALIDLEEGFRLMTNVVGSDPEAVAIDQPVEIVFEDRGEGLAVPQAKVRG